MTTIWQGTNDRFHHRDGRPIPVDRIAGAYLTEQVETEDGTLLYRLSVVDGPDGSGESELLSAERLTFGEAEALLDDRGWDLVHVRQEGVTSQYARWVSAGDYIVATLLRRA